MPAFKQSDAQQSKATPQPIEVRTESTKPTTEEIIASLHDSLKALEKYGPAQEFADPIKPATSQYPSLPSPNDMKAAFDKAESSKQVALAALDRKEYPTALDSLDRCVDSLRRAESHSSDPKDREIIHDMITSEQNRAIIICYSGVNESNTTNGISKDWQHRIEQLASPDRLVNLHLDFVVLDWKVFVSFAGVQQHLADCYIRQQDYSRAQWHFAVAESCFEQYELTAPQHILASAEQIRWRALNKSRLRDLIAAKGIVKGIYIQNSGKIQSWIAKVIAVNGDAITARITFRSSLAPSGFVEGQPVHLIRSEIKVMESPSILAVVRGYR